MRSFDKNRGGGRGQSQSRPRYDGREEVPVLELKSDLGTVRYYGSGRAVFDIPGATISARFACRWSAGRWFVVLTERQRQEGVPVLKKIEQEVKANVEGKPRLSDADSFPNIIEYLISSSYPDGSKREPSSLIIVADPSGWRVCLSDKDNGRVMWKVADALQDALLAIEMALMEEDQSSWRKASGANPRAKKRS